MFSVAVREDTVCSLRRAKACFDERHHAVSQTKPHEDPCRPTSTRLLYCTELTSGYTEKEPKCRHQHRRHHMQDATDGSDRESPAQGPASCLCQDHEGE